METRPIQCRIGLFQSALGIYYKESHTQFPPRSFIQNHENQTQNQYRVSLIVRACPLKSGQCRFPNRFLTWRTCSWPPHIACLWSSVLWSSNGKSVSMSIHIYNDENATVRLTCQILNAVTNSNRLFLAPSQPCLPPSSTRRLTEMPARKSVIWLSLQWSNNGRPRFRTLGSLTGLRLLFSKVLPSPPSWTGALFCRRRLFRSLFLNAELA